MTYVKRAKSSLDLIDFQEDTLRVSGFEIRQVSISDQEEWTLKNGGLRHHTGGFFHICGFREEPSEREHLVLYQPQGAFNGLLIHRHEGEVFVLLQARIEPGNTGVCQYGPTVQSTPANYLRQHKGKATPYLDHFFGCVPGAQLLSASNQLDLGQRYFQKTKELRYVEVDEMIPTAENMIWTNLKTVQSCLEHDHFLNTDLRSMLGVFDWTGYIEPEPSSGVHADELTIPAIKPYASTGKLVALHDLNEWRIDDQGVYYQGVAGVHVRLFETSCTNREVRKWVQPLVCVDQKGEFTLCIKEGSAGTEILLQLGDEFGVRSGQAWMPSYYNYDGRDEFIPQAGDELLSEVEQSEEGGRFYLNENVYRVYRLAESTAIDIGDNHMWFSVAQLKSLLASSNQVSIQLRCMASMIFDVLNASFSELVLEGGRQV